ncbi:hypothetical protein P152DRAFT_206684 [Eremomyces bilateralis CBS 781.70]|uniref:Uncharacterized protein n=1 Tax=Eremomyces bilateralis CBS 781.70 TaxID=1392243 RepID=A0A6G1FSX7_9PEZI|nr:uncharacterized protein P152DRAFT_206684 [Eremomyces bilateralis CBS 781.70]KAF1808874.1 hypothetical protein P152DRAFT_206684 [Eremomyces bilateralis CBS 781.70]
MPFQCTKTFREQQPSEKQIVQILGDGRQWFLDGCSLLFLFSFSLSLLMLCFSSLLTGWLKTQKHMETTKLQKKNHQSWFVTTCLFTIPMPLFGTPKNFH